MLHCVAPQQSLIIANPALAIVGLLGGGSAFFSAGLPAVFKKRIPLKPRVVQAISLYFWIKGHNPLLPLPLP